MANGIESIPQAWVLVVSITAGGSAFAASRILKSRALAIRLLFSFVITVVVLLILLWLNERYINPYPGRIDIL
jgi:hypothetical protein